MMKKILVIEDEEFVRENLVELLDAEGFEVFDAENGFRGIDVARIKIPDLILCDVMMPGLDGFGVLETLRKEVALASDPFYFLNSKSGEV